MLPHKDKIAFITGANRGIGLAIALELGRQGAFVVGTSINSEDADSFKQSLKEKNIQGASVVLDVTEKVAVRELIDNISKEFGAPTILVNNAGITQDNLMLRMKDEQWDKVINTNLNSIFHVTQTCLRGMLKAKWGRIISIASVVGCTGNVGQANYAAAKAGLIGFSKSLAQEIAIRNITVNTIAPGFIDTAMTRNMEAAHREFLLSRIPMQRMGEPEDIANAVNFLASPAASYITGETIHVNGGMYMN